MILSRLLKLSLLIYKMSIISMLNFIDGIFKNNAYEMLRIVADTLRATFSCLHVYVLTSIASLIRDLDNELCHFFILKVSVDCDKNW